jgi:hypothetical protein
MSLSSDTDTPFGTLRFERRTEYNDSLTGISLVVERSLLPSGILV